MAKELRIGLLGFGTVGSAVYTRLADDRLARQLGRRLTVVAAVVRDPHKPRPLPTPAGFLTTDAEALLTDPSVEVIVEAVGGLEPAGRWVRSALARGKHVITANKQLVASQRPALTHLARRHRVGLAFEAAVGAGIPLLRPLARYLPGTTVQRVTAVLNGTCNYLATGMEAHGWSWDETMRRAQSLGYAEADPGDDVDAHDAASKLAILASLAFGGAYTASAVTRQGIRDLTPQALAGAVALGLRVRLLAVAERAWQMGGISLRVGPVALPADHPLARLEGPENGVLVEGQPFGRLYWTGPGAGGPATAAAVVADLIALLQGDGGTEPTLVPAAGPVLVAPAVPSRQYAYWPGRGGAVVQGSTRGAAFVCPVWQEGPVASAVPAAEAVT